MKLRGPKALANQEPSRLIPTAIDAVIDSSDVLLLQYAYSDKTWDNITVAVIKRLPTIYGLSLPSEPLRHAILALSAAYIGNMHHVEQMESHSCKAKAWLIKRLYTPSLIDEFDVLASFILAIQAWRRSDSLHEISVHVRGCASMLQYLASQLRLSDVLKVFGPLIFDYLTLLEFWVKFDPQKTLEARYTVFGQELYFQQRVYYRNSH